MPRGSRISHEWSRKNRLISPTMVGTAKDRKSSLRPGCHRLAAFTKPTYASCSSSALSTPRPRYRAATDRATGMYSLITCPRRRRCSTGSAHPARSSNCSRNRRLRSRGGAAEKVRPECGRRSWEGGGARVDVGTGLSRGSGIVLAPCLDQVTITTCRGVRFNRQPRKIPRATPGEPFGRADCGRETHAGNARRRHGRERWSTDVRLRAVRCGADTVVGRRVRPPRIHFPGKCTPVGFLQEMVGDISQVQHTEQAAVVDHRQQGKALTQQQRQHRPVHRPIRDDHRPITAHQRRPPEHDAGPDRPRQPVPGCPDRTPCRQNGSPRRRPRPPALPSTASVERPVPRCRTPRPRPADQTSADPRSPPQAPMPCFTGNRTARECAVRRPRRSVRRPPAGSRSPRTRHHTPSGKRASGPFEPPDPSITPHRLNSQTPRSRNPQASRTPLSAPPSSAHPHQHAPTTAQRPAAQELIVNWILAVEAAVSEKITVNLVGPDRRGGRRQRRNRWHPENACVGRRVCCAERGNGDAFRDPGRLCPSTRPGIGRVEGHRRWSEEGFPAIAPGAGGPTPGDVDAELKDVTAHCGDKGLSNDQRS